MRDHTNAVRVLAAALAAFGCGMNHDFDGDAGALSEAGDAGIAELVKVLDPPALDTGRAVTFHFTVGAGFAVECALDDAPYAACAGGSVAYDGLACGVHIFHARARSAGGAVGPETRVKWYVDCVAPVVSIDPIMGGTTGPSGRHTFSSDDHEARYECRIDDGPFAPCTTEQGFAFGGLAAGEHSVSVHAIDALGNVGDAVARWRVEAEISVVSSFTRIAFSRADGTVIADGPSAPGGVTRHWLPAGGSVTMLAGSLTPQSYEKGEEELVTILAAQPGDRLVLYPGPRGYDYDAVAAQARLRLPQGYDADAYRFEMGGRCGGGNYGAFDGIYDWPLRGSCLDDQDRWNALVWPSDSDASYSFLVGEPFAPEVATLPPFMPASLLRVAAADAPAGTTSGYWAHFLRHGQRYGQSRGPAGLPGAVRVPDSFVDGYRIESVTSWPSAGGRALRTGIVRDFPKAESLTMGLGEPLPLIGDVAVSGKTVSWSVAWGGASPAGGVIRLRATHDRLVYDRFGSHVASYTTHWTLVFPPGWTSVTLPPLPAEWKDSQAGFEPGEPFTVDAVGFIEGAAVPDYDAMRAGFPFTHPEGAPTGSVEGDRLQLLSPIRTTVSSAP